MEIYNPLSDERRFTSTCVARLNAFQFREDSTLRKVHRKRSLSRAYSRTSVPKVIKEYVGRNLRRVDLSIRREANAPLFYTLAFAQLTRVSGPVISLTSRLLWITVFLLFLLGTVLLTRGLGHRWSTLRITYCGAVF